MFPGNFKYLYRWPSCIHTRSLCLICPMLHLSLYFTFLIAPSVFLHVYFFIIEYAYHRTKKDIQLNYQKNKNEMFYKSLHRKLRSRNTNPTKKRVWPQDFRNGRQFLFYYWHPSCYTLISNRLSMTCTFSL